MSRSSRPIFYCSDLFSSYFKPIVKAFKLARESVVIFLALKYCSRSHAAFNSSSSSASARLSRDVNREWNFENSLLLSTARRRRFALLTKVRQTTRTPAVMSNTITILWFLPSSKKLLTRPRNRMLARGSRRRRGPAFFMIKMRTFRRRSKEFYAVITTASVKTFICRKKIVLLV